MFEKDLPGANTTGFGGAAVSALPAETCETMNNSWGFYFKDDNYKSSKQLIHYLVNAAGRNANFLLNIGPMRRMVESKRNLQIHLLSLVNGCGKMEKVCMVHGGMLLLLKIGGC